MVILTINKSKIKYKGTASWMKRGALGDTALLKDLLTEEQTSTLPWTAVHGKATLFVNSENDVRLLLSGFVNWAHKEWMFRVSPAMYSVRM